MTATASVAFLAGDSDRMSRMPACEPLQWNGTPLYRAAVFVSTLVICRMRVKHRVLERFFISHAERPWPCDFEALDIERYCMSLASQN